MKWTQRVGSYEVQERESRRPGGQAYIPLGDAYQVVLHTTEGTSVDGAWNTLNSNGSAPHFLVGEGRIVQMRPLDVQAATLRDNASDPGHPNEGRIQIEAVFRVGDIGLRPHRMVPGTFGPLVHLARYLKDELGIPLARPGGWPDDLRQDDPGGVWAGNNSRRKSRRADGFRGWVGHIEIPDQSPTWHWDPGSFEYAALFEAAEVLGGEGDEMTPEQREKLNTLYAFYRGVEAFNKGNEPDLTQKPVPFRQGYRLAKRAASCTCQPAAPEGSDA